MLRPIFLLLVLAVPASIAAEPRDIAVLAEGATAGGAAFVFQYSGFNGGCGSLTVLGAPSRGACADVGGGTLSHLFVQGPGVSLRGPGPQPCPYAPGAGAFALTGTIDGERAAGVAQVVVAGC